MGVVWCKRAWEVRGVEHGRVDGCLQVLSENGVSEEKLKRPLVLLVAAGCAERKAWFAVAKRERRAERGPRPFAAFQVIGMLGVEVEHLGSRAEAEAEAWDHRRALQPSTARGVRAWRTPCRGGCDRRTGSRWRQGRRARGAAAVEGRRAPGSTARTWPRSSRENQRSQALHAWPERRQGPQP